MTAKSTDVLLIGAGAMSTTLGMLLKQLDPSLNMIMVERLDHVAHESTDGWNNAGTGHAAYCELNYTPQQADGSINTSKAFAINSAFEVSLQFWSYLVEQKAMPSPEQFINPTPHSSFVWGEKNVQFLRARYEAMRATANFEDMEYSEDHAIISQWMPLVMKNRDPNEKVAATRVRYGSDVDFGSVARNMVKHLQQQEGFELLLSHNVQDLKKGSDGRWTVTLKNKQGKTVVVNAGFVFLGAGGGALPLLQKSGIKEGKGYGGFPVSGMWLVCKDPAIVEQHMAKVYGLAPIGAPPMSVPHLDTRVINGKKALLFGPFAGFTTKFLKQGSFFDLPSSINAGNLLPIMSVGMNNMDLTRYLISEVRQSHTARCDSLRNFFPEAKDDDWELAMAGQRVQIIKKDPNGGGKLEFGTEAISSEDGTLAALLGASPGASTSVNTMIGIIEKCFADRMQSAEWQAKMKEMVPSYGQSLTGNAELLKTVRERTLRTLKLDRLA
ncbi:malate dehydrogenase (quinone) [Oceanospirillum multiglobuliferum]|uniref:Probable malate:quinone oxidoreductase n=1 Tax=Oceanospirillum multiglobuliferum TaxID=64969 RepID=A0A1V4T4V0_9GAMM|nr:malate dehydrogenase (quinone) [Oceanospirillum multiglobuliferum]OPX55576.1 malate dehydrogenase (quinone) [Oceanospirillum multiglobuliferum]